jgi:hypothetical protein
MRIVGYTSRKIKIYISEIRKNFRILLNRRLR